MKKKRTALITGATSGIGFELVKLFAADSIDLLLVSRNRKKLLEIKKLTIQEYKINVDIFACDLAVPNSASKVLEFCLLNKIRIDYLVNTTGVLWFDKDVSAVNIDDKVWDKVFQINLKSMVFLSKLVVPKMMKNKFGSMVHISSIDALSGDDKPQDAYGASKAAMIRLSKSFAIQFAQNKIRSNIILPGPIETGMQVRWKKDPKAKKNLEKLIPLNKVGKPDDISNASMFLLSDQASYITGTELIVDGGWSSKGL